MVYCLFPSGAIGFPALFPRIPGACPQPLSPVLCEDQPLPCGKHGAGAARVFLPGEELAARALERQVECDLLRAEVRSDCHLVAAGRAGKQHQAVGCSFAERVCGLPAAFSGRAQELELPSAPKQFLHYFTENARPQPTLDRNTENGMAVCIGRLREDTLFDYKFACMSHNTLRGAAGGGVLLAELLAAKGYFD